MPSIPSTRQKTFKSSKEDAIQWSLTNHHSKTYLETTICKYSKSKSTLDVAKKFIKLLNNANNESDKITEIIKDITCLYQTISFNSKQFLEYIFEHATSSNIRILVLYSKIVSQLQVLALSTRLILSYVPHLDETLIRLISFEENEIAEDIRHKLIMKGGRQLVNWNESMQIDHVKFMLYLLKQEITFEDRHLVLVQLLKLSNMGTTTTQDMYHNLQKVKTNIPIGN
ncbi:uncharacterized protein BX663DRAFT_22619 [Cokeromyces recurvatus]|uniref:uncharacterized protein n=1 Tax=Cokeromyces recurvatus TaxID=90255 RepID=UPI00221E5624|nr:uncharacterized protein BX663DRAFT_22619 [Cokeromyces recurvatus]KAI7908153.1 hypothetical protein BX663DRAFT_22619 [Cokeromyces recurvatus]